MSIQTDPVMYARVTDRRDHLFSRELIVPHHKVTFWIMQGPGWLLLAYLVIAQGVSALDYQLGVAMGTQEPADVITVVAARDAQGWLLSTETDYWLVLPIITMWGIWGLWQQSRQLSVTEIASG